jgi:hypothetical protein
MQKGFWEEITRRKSSYNARRVAFHFQRANDQNTIKYRQKHKGKNKKQKEILKGQKKKK